MLTKTKDGLPVVEFKMADVMKVAAELCEKDSRTEQKQYGHLLPCRKISPLEPFIKLEEYFMLERDTGKCKQAIFVVNFLFLSFNSLI